jgi:hypothetical protein
VLLLPCCLMLLSKAACAASMWVRMQSRQALLLVLWLLWPQERCWVYMSRIILLRMQLHI